MEMVFHAPVPANSADSAHELRAFGWPELCARLVAAQDLRRVIAQEEGIAGVTGSFHRAAARALARQRENEMVVNLNLSADGKRTLGTQADEGRLRPGQG